MSQTINPQEAVKRLLSSATEDYFGLYEVIWEFNAAFPHASIGEKYGAAEAAVRDLLGRGWIALYRRKDGFTQSSPRYEQIEPEQVEAVLQNPTSWYPEYADERIECTTTEAGDNAYYGGELRRNSERPTEKSANAQV